jgi:hypothetical protein
LAVEEEKATFVRRSRGPFDHSAEQVLCTRRF